MGDQTIGGMNSLENRFQASGRAIAFTALLFLSGCGAKVQRPTEEVVEQTYPIDRTASVRIANAHGPISIKGTDTPELRIRAVKKAGSAEQLKNIKLDVVARSTSATITTNFLRPKNHAFTSARATVDYTILLPRTAKVRVDADDGQVLLEGMRAKDVEANVVDGNIVIRDCCGSVRAAVAHGQVDLAYRECEQMPLAIDARITNGSAQLLVPGSASFHLRAETETGTITNEFPALVEVNGRAKNKIDTDVGSGGPSEIKIHITKGDIKIARD